MSMNNIYYYPIKCPYCLKDNSNDTVLFNVDDLGTKCSNKLEECLPELKKGKRFYTYAELKELLDKNTNSSYIIEFAKRPNSFKGIQNIALQNKEYSDDMLLTSISVEIVDNVTKLPFVSAHTLDRYCECKNKLVRNSGTIPSFMFTLLGSRNAGKTTYLLSLFQELSIKGKDVLIPGMEITVNNLAIKEKNPSNIRTMAYELFDEGILPINTLASDNEPLALEVQVKYMGVDVSNALLFFKDMPGEWFTNTGSENLDLMNNQFLKFNGYIVVFDPNCFETPLSTGETEVDEDSKKYISLLADTIRNNIVMPRGEIRLKQPAVAIVTKCDAFYHVNNEGAIAAKNISYSTPPLALSTSTMNFQKVNKGVYCMLEQFSQSSISLMDSNFDNHFYFMVSSFLKSGDVILEKVDHEKITTEEDGSGKKIEKKTTEVRTKIKNPELLDPWNVTAPLLRLLMDAEIAVLPPFHTLDLWSVEDEERIKHKIRKKTLENTAKYEKRLSGEIRKCKNGKQTVIQDAINDWRSKHGIF